MTRFRIVATTVALTAPFLFLHAADALAWRSSWG